MQRNKESKIFETLKSNQKKKKKLQSKEDELKIMWLDG